MKARLGSFLAFLLVIAASNLYAQDQQKVLVEMFTNTNCGNCRVPDLAYDDFVHSNPQYGVVRIVYHNGIPDNKDVFYVPARADVDVRGNLYAVPSDPRGIIDGFGVGNSSSDWAAATQAAAASTLPITVGVTVTPQTAGHYTVQVSLSGSVAKQVKLFVALTEDHLVYDNSDAFGNQPSGYWDNIFRQMLPSSTGSDPMQISGTQNFTYDVDLSDQDWVASNMHVIAFVQDVNATSGPNYQVEGFHSVPLANPASVATSVGTNGNQVSVTNTGVRLDGVVGAGSLAISDILGRQVAYVPFDNFNGASTIIPWPSGLPSGLYIATVSNSTGPLARLKVVR